MKKIAFVTPWYGEDIPGGMESELRGLVHHFAAIKLNVEILTTTIRDFHGEWDENYYSEGVEVCNNIAVRRFRVFRRNKAEFDRVNGKFLGRERTYWDDEQIFFREMIKAFDLYCYIRDHKEEYALFVFIPYMFGTTYYGIDVCKEKAVVIPCLHNEPYAYMRAFRERFPKIRGMIFNSSAEAELANQIYDLQNVQCIVTGIGMETKVSGDAKRFRHKFHIDAPFVLYAGRKDPGKGIYELFYNFEAWKSKRKSDVQLVLLGGGQVKIPDTIAHEVHDLGFVSEQDKYDAYMASSLFCLPSQFESFSIVIMESWLFGRPVLVNGHCSVTRDFVKESNGGLWYETQNEFIACMDFFFHHSGIAATMGKNGCAFVRKNFSWAMVLHKYLQFFEKLSGESFSALDPTGRHDDPATSWGAATQEKKVRGNVAYFADNDSMPKVKETVEWFDAFTQMDTALCLTFHIYNSLPLGIGERPGIVEHGFVPDEEAIVEASRMDVMWIPYRRPCCLRKMVSVGLPFLVAREASAFWRTCEQHDMGLYYDDQVEWAAGLRFLLQHRDEIIPAVGESDDDRGLTEKRGLAKRERLAEACFVFYAGRLMHKTFAMYALMLYGTLQKQGLPLSGLYMVCRDSQLRFGLEKVVGSLCTEFRIDGVRFSEDIPPQKGLVFFFVGDGEWRDVIRWGQKVQASETWILSPNPEDVSKHHVILADIDDIDGTVENICDVLYAEDLKENGIQD